MHDYPIANNKSNLCVCTYVLELCSPCCVMSLAYCNLAGCVCSMMYAWVMGVSLIGMPLSCSVIRGLSGLSRAVLRCRGDNQEMSLA